MLESRTDETLSAARDDASQFEDLLACACPGKSSRIDQAPGCQAERLLGASTLLLIVKPGMQGPLNCKKLIFFGSGHFCRCPQRIAYFKKYGF